jgi:ribosomal-protein-alanine N-acetyltransferase
MRLVDLDRILEIELHSFPTPWSRRSFISELTENIYAHYVVLEEDEHIVAYCGMWVILDEAHITNIAVAPEARGKGYGEYLFRDMIERSKSRGARRMTLEVRVSNEVAKSLYKKLGFEARGLRKGYYSDTGEDAIVMWLDDLGPVRAINEGVRYGS